MNKQTEALKMAMETMEATLLVGHIPTFAMNEALKACKEALEQPAQEPLSRAQQVIRANNSAVKTLVRGKYGSSNDYYVIRYIPKSKKGSDA